MDIEIAEAKRKNNNNNALITRANAKKKKKSFSCAASKFSTWLRINELDLLLSLSRVGRLQNCHAPHERAPEVGEKIQVN